jgi:deazaflavin-dependent oxidoreductase (nitroreductase family)
MPSDRAFRAMNAAHRVLLKLSAGRMGWNVSNMPVLELTTKGRKTGIPRSVMLTSPLQDGTTFIVVASRGGADLPPAWFLNLRDNPEVEVTLHGQPAQHIRARIAGPDERRRLWPRIVSDHKNYADYQRKTTRELPLVLLEQLVLPPPEQRGQPSA